VEIKKKFMADKYCLNWSLSLVLLKYKPWLLASGYGHKMQNNLRSKTDQHLLGFIIFFILLIVN
jgi:hypothetical protein